MGPRPSAAPTAVVVPVLKSALIDSRVRDSPEYVDVDRATDLFDGLPGAVLFSD
ncbi:MAG: hypothetical protein ABI442_15095 [Gemmatimonadaceae bacterium]